MRALRWLCVILAMLVVASVRGQSLPNGVISGIVTDAVDGRPLSGVRVHISPYVGVLRPDSTDAETDEFGRFAFTHLAAGRYTVESRHPDYFLAYFTLGAAAAGNRTVIVLGDGQHFVANMALRGVSSISGRVTDEHGAPVPGAFVQLLVAQSMFGADRVFAAPYASTNARGEYAFATLDPGTYRLMVSATAHTRATTKTEPVYSQVLYPDVTALAAAQPLELRPGETRADIDLVRRQVEGHRVSGKLQGDAVAFAGLMLRLVPDGLIDIGPRADAATTFVEKDGTFTFLNVPTGDYTLIANRTSVEFASFTSAVSVPAVPGLKLYNAASSLPMTLDDGMTLRYKTARQLGPAFAGYQRLSVQRDDVKDVVVASQPTTSLRVMLDDADDPAPSVQVQFDPVAPSDLRPFVARVSRGQPSSIDGLSPGEYVLRCDQPVGRMFLGDEDVLGRPIRIDEASATKTLTIRTVFRRTASLAGVVRDSKGATVPGANVLIFPADATRWREGGGDYLSMRPWQADTAGYVTVSALIPGDYMVIAVPPDRSVMSPSADFLRTARLAAAKVKLVASQTAVVGIPLLANPPR